MASSVTVRVLSNRLPGIPAAIRSAVAAEISKTAFGIQADAQAKAPVLTGTLRRSITTQIGAGGMSARVGPSVNYGLFVEMGTRRMGARPYLRPAAEAAAPRFVAGIRAALARL